MDLIGLPLEAARKLVQDDPAARNLELQVLETAPPFVSKHRTPIWGELRVLRAIQRETMLELLVARELLGETVSPRDDGTQSS